MVRILVQPEELARLGAAMRKASHDLQAATSRCTAAFDGLIWESSRYAAVDARVERLRVEGERLAREAGELAGYLQRKAEAFSRADTAGATALAQAAAPLLGFLAGTPPAQEPTPAPAQPPASPGAPATGWAGEERFFQGIDLSRYYTPAQARALRYTLQQEGKGFETVHGSVFYEAKDGEYRWDRTLLNYGIISFAFPVGGGYGLLHSLVNDPAAAGELERLFPQYIDNPELLAGFRQAFSSGEGKAADWWREHGMADAHHLRPEWAGLLAAWAQTDANKEIQVQHVGPYMETAVRWAKDYGIQSERGLAFLFDVSVQEGGQHVAEWNELMNKTENWSDLSEAEKLELMLRDVTVGDSRKRKVPIVHGGPEFEEQWNLSYHRPWQVAGMAGG